MPADNEQRNDAEQANPKWNVFWEANTTVSDVSLGEWVNMSLLTSYEVGEADGRHADDAGQNGEHVSSKAKCLLLIVHPII